MKVFGNAPKEQPPCGSHPARCIKVIDFGTQPVTWQGQTKHQHKVWISWELPDCKMAGIYKPELKGKPFGVSRTFTLSLAANSGLKAALESWRGRKYSKDEIAAGVDLKKLLGVPCLITLIESEDGQFVNVDTIAPLPKGMKIGKQVNPSVHLSLDREEFDPAVFDSLSDGLKTKIAASPEFQQLEESSAEEDEANEPDAQPGADSVQGDGEEPF